MKNYINYILALCFICACANISKLKAQTEVDNRVVVYLDNGSQFEAKLVEWNQETDIMTFEAFGSKLEFANSDIKKIVHLGIDDSASYNFKETGNYYHLRMNVITGNPGNRQHSDPGIGVSFSTGKRFNRFASVGVGVGFDEFIVGTSENILSVFGEFSGYLLESNQSLSYNLAAGYGFAFVDEDSNLTSASGGWMVHPAVGLRLGKKRLKWTIDVGYKFQEANWVYQFWNSTSDQDILYRRLTVRTGVMF